MCEYGDLSLLLKNLQHDRILWHLDVLAEHDENVSIFSSLERLELGQLLPEAMLLLKYRLVWQLGSR